MPHLHRSPSSPSLRDPSTQAFDEIFRRRRPMPASSNGARPSPIRHLSTRRPRPSIASIADLFVGSLVLAGFCHDHSPRSRGVSTLSLKTSQGSSPRGGAKYLEERSGVSCGGRREFSSSANRAVQSSHSRSWLGYGLAQVAEDNEERRRSRASKEQEEDAKMKGNSHALDTQLTGDHMHPQFQRDFFDSLADDNQPTPQRQNLNSTNNSHRVRQPSPTYNERAQTAISHLFRRLLGSGHDWNEAIDAMMTHPPPVRTNDDTRDVMESPSVAKLVEMLPSEQQAPTQLLFRLYRDLPSPGVAYLSKASRGLLLRRFANPPNRRAVDARRYLSLVEDMKSAGLPLSRSLWSSAIYMAGRSSNGRVSKHRLVQAIGLWQQMEHLANIKADDVVFTILFDIAVKANQFVVAERLEKEMKKRDIRFQRWGLVSKIFSCGVRKNAEGVRANFDSFVSSGELVDTVVLNCVMSSFLRAGDTVTAKALYAQMLDSQEAQNRRDASLNEATIEDPVPSLATEFTFYRTKTKQLGNMLKKSKHLRHRLPAFHRALQDSLPMTPDTRTFYIWLQHCARRSGNLKMFMQVVEDMERTFTVPPRHMIYLLLFEGFSLHGRTKKTTPEWTRERLRLTWLGFIRAVRDSRARHLGLYQGPPGVTWDNPLRSVGPELNLEKEAASFDAPNKPDDLYVPLPSMSSESSTIVDRPDNESSQEAATDHESNVDQEDEIWEEEDPFAEDEPEGGDDAQISGIPENAGDALDTLESNFNVPVLTTEQEMDLNRQNIEYLATRLDNGVFVGRRMAIAILQAFGTCCGPDQVMEAWLQLEELWPSSKRTAIDMLIVREVVEDQMGQKHR